VSRVVVGCVDPNPDVDGKGVAMLRNAGITVDRPDRALEAECRQLIAPFIARTVHRRPYVTMKWAESSNGKVSGPRGQRVRITNDASDRVVHALRARCDAIAVGTNTVLADDPLLTARGVDRPLGRPPLLRVVLSNSLKLPVEGRLVATAREHPVVVYSSTWGVGRSADAVAALRARGVEVVSLPDRDGHFSFADVLSDLCARRVMHLLVEPGPTLTKYLFARGQADRVWVFRSTRSIEGDGALAIASAPPVDYPKTGEVPLDGDVLSEYLNPSSPVFFAAARSADLVFSTPRTGETPASEERRP
jgi:diaminohydroxyphosphoribosylaminopyrimidine deaminase/5-amino-6-(5-phosphoribosylamino)uracil reductase